MKVTLRPYQVELVDAIRTSIIRGHRRILAVLPTGGGKTSVAGHIIEGASKKGNKMIFLAHRKELITQTSARLDLFGVDHGIIMAQSGRRNPYMPVQVASIMTLIRRQLPEAQIIFVDEAHRVMGDSYVKILASYPQAIVIGLTATPVRLDGKGLGNIFEDMVEVIGINDLIEQGFLVQPRTFAPAELDLSGVRMTAGDFNRKDLAKMVDKSTLIGDIVQNWKDKADGRPTVAFATSIEHSLHIVDEFRRAGVKARHLDAETHPDERDEILAQIANGDITLVSNMGILTEGWDCPNVSCAILARPTMSESLYLQMAGRALRPHPGKEDCIILDHAYCTWMHGLVTDVREWSLEGRKKKKSPPSMKSCPNCYACLVSTVRVCPECLHEFASDAVTDMARLGEIPKTKAGELVEVTRAPTRDEKQAMYNQLWDQALRNGYKPTWVRMRYKEIFGMEPKGLVRSQAAEAAFRLDQQRRKEAYFSRQAANA